MVASDSLYLRGLRPGDDGCPGKIPQLREAFTGHFDDDHRFLLARVDGIDTDIAALDAQIGTHLAPFAPVALRLDEVPGIGPVAAAVIIAEIGVDMTRFPAPGHIYSWAKFEPGVKTSAGKNKGNGSTGHGNRDLGVRAARRELIAFAVRMR